MVLVLLAWNFIYLNFLTKFQLQDIFLQFSSMNNFAINFFFLRPIKFCQSDLRMFLISSKTIAKF